MIEGHAFLEKRIHAVYSNLNFIKIYIYIYFNRERR